ncbi:hypothetical protein BGZ76_010924 [Entomortierella beljakovae]|nr:hypothetical protein BGZ76_010924 [Entomortierella beljakovae]
MSRIMEDVDLGIIIASCNELLSFRIVNQWYGSYRINISTLPGTDPATLQPINSKIQSLAMTGMCIDLEALESLLGRCPKLTSIKLVHIRQIESPLGKENFYDSVTKSCPELKQFHFSTLNDSPAPDHAHSLMHTSFSSSTYIPSVSKDGESKEEEVEGQSGDQLVRQIKSNINTISILDSDVKEETASILFSPLMDPILSQFVSRLEIMPSIGHVKYNCLINTLHNVLCSAPNLLHLIAPSVPYYAEYFDLTSPQNNNKVWACRGLRTVEPQVGGRFMFLVETEGTEEACSCNQDQDEAQEEGFSVDVELEFQSKSILVQWVVWFEEKKQSQKYFGFVKDSL